MLSLSQHLAGGGGGFLDDAIGGFVGEPLQPIYLLPGAKDSRHNI